MSLFARAQAEKANAALRSAGFSSATSAVFARISPCFIYPLVEGSGLGSCGAGQWDDIAQDRVRCAGEVNVLYDE